MNLKLYILHFIIPIALRDWDCFLILFDVTYFDVSDITQFTNFQTCELLPI